MDYIYGFENNNHKKFRNIIIIILVIVIAVILSAFLFKNSSNKIISKVSSVIIYPFNKIYDFTSSTTSGFRKYFSDKKKLYLENENLKKEIDEIKLKQIENQKIIDENVSLKQMLEIKKEFKHFNLKMGKIMYREHDNWTQTFKIDIGKEDGIKEKQVVIHKEGLVGYISSVEDNTSTVTTILDPSSSVSVNISTINEPAILKGDLKLKSSNKLALEFIPLGAEISIDDMLYTSGLGSIYPSSLPVGKISEVLKNKNDMNRSAIVTPNVNIRTIKEVAVIVD